MLTFDLLPHHLGCDSLVTLTLSFAWPSPPALPSLPRPAAHSPLGPWGMALLQETGRAQNSGCTKPRPLHERRPLVQVRLAASSGKLPLCSVLLPLGTGLPSASPLWFHQKSALRPRSLSPLRTQLPQPLISCIRLALLRPHTSLWLCPPGRIPEHMCQGQEGRKASPRR